LLILSLMHVVNFGWINAGTCGPDQKTERIVTFFPSLSQTHGTSATEALAKPR